MNQIQAIFRIPAATDPVEVVDILHGGGISAVIPPSGIMPTSKQNGGSALVHTLCYTEDYQAIVDVTTTQRPVWQIFYAGEAFPRHNPDYAPEDELSLPMLPVIEHEPLNPSVWNFVPDTALYDENGNVVGSAPAQQLHQWQGVAVLRRES